MCYGAGAKLVLRIRTIEGWNYESERKLRKIGVPI